MIHKGNLEITSKNAANYKDLTEVTGNLYINSNVELSALKNVGRDLFINSNVELSALKNVGRDLYINSNVELSALKNVGRDLFINSNVELSAPLLESVGGGLYINSNVELSALKNVGGNLYINSNVELSAPLLESVGGDLFINSNVELSAPLLESVGGDLFINSNAINQFPNNVKIKCLRNICGNIGRMKFELIDGIACAVLSVKSKDGLTIKRCRKSIFSDGALIGDQFFVASNDKNNAHGKTIKEAIDELAFKEMSRDVEKYKNMPLKTKKKPDEWALIYRAITGACRLGTEMFLSKKRLKRSYSLEEILKETEGAYGSNEFKEVVKSNS